MERNHCTFAISGDEPAVPRRDARPNPPGNLNAVLIPLAVLAVLLVALVAGCGGGGGAKGGTGGGTGAQTGTVTFTIKWPVQSATAPKTRVIPTAANSIVISLSSSANSYSSGPIARPTSTWTSPPIAAGTYTLTAQAFPMTNGTGVVQAVGTGSITIVNGQNTSATVTMGSTVTALTINPNSPQVVVGGQTVVFASATDSKGDIVIFAPQAVSWTSSVSSVATIGSTGVTPTATGVAVGTTSIGATFNEVEPSLGQKPVAAKPVTLTVGTSATIGLANSTWPKFHANALSTGLLAGTIPASEGAVQWSLATDNPLNGDPVIGADGTIYIPDGSSLDAVTPGGVKKWSFQTTASVTDAAVSADGTIYTGSGTNVYAITPTGSQKWSFKTGGTVTTGMAINPMDGSIFCVASVAGFANLYALNPDGTERWSYNLGGSNYGVPTIGSDGTIYGGGGGGTGTLLAINPSGTLRWGYFLGYSAIPASPAIDSSGNVYYGIGNELGALSSTGKFLWQFLTKKAVLSSPAIGADGTIYVASTDGNLYAVSTGNKKWVFATGGPIISSPAIGSDGTIYVASGDGNLYAVSSAGKENWSLPIGASNLASSPAIGADGTVYVGSDTNKLYAVAGGSATVTVQSVPRAKRRAR